jgi:hypothetical protein
MKLSIFIKVNASGVKACRFAKFGPTDGCEKVSET